MAELCELDRKIRKTRLRTTDSMTIGRLDRVIDDGPVNEDNPHALASHPRARIDDAPRLCPEGIFADPLIWNPTGLGRIAAARERARNMVRREIDQHIMAQHGAGRVSGDGVHHIDEILDFHVEARFLLHLADDRVSQTFPAFESASGDAPFPEPRLFAATDENDLILRVPDHRAHPDNGGGAVNRGDSFTGHAAILPGKEDEITRSANFPDCFFNVMKGAQGARRDI